MSRDVQARATPQVPRRRATEIRFAEVVKREVGAEVVGDLVADTAAHRECIAQIGACEVDLIVVTALEVARATQIGPTVSHVATKIPARGFGDDDFRRHFRNRLDGSEIGRKRI